MASMISSGPDLAIARAEVESLARAAAAAGCDWAAADLQLYFRECSDTQQVDTSMLASVIGYWQSRFSAALADPTMRRPPYLPLIEARQILANAQTRLQNLSVRDPARFREVMARYQAAGDDREKALILTSAEAAASMLPQGLVLGQPTPPVAEAGQLIQRLRASGLELSATDDGRISVRGGSLSGSQRERLAALRSEIVQLLNAPPTEIV